MQCNRFKKTTLFLMIGFFISQCGSTNSIFVSEDDKNRMDVLLQLARFHYDQGNYTEAEESITKAKEISPLNEDANQLSAAIDFAKAGFNFFDVLTKIIQIQLNNTSSKSGGATDLLGNFSALLNLGPTDLTSMSSGSSISTNQFLSGLDVYYPASPGNYTEGGPRGTVATLNNINKTIHTLCPFISESVRTKVDTNIRYQCSVSSNSLKKRGQTHFLFALAHLVEAVAFNMLILYEPESFDGEKEEEFEEERIGSTTSAALTGNLIARANRLGTFSITLSNLSDYVAAVNQIKTDIDAVLDTTAGSMLNQTMLNFSMSATAFGAIPGMPSDVTNSIESQLTSIESAVQSAGAQKENLDAQAGVFKKQINNKLLPKLESSITTFDNLIRRNGELSGDEQTQLDEVCTAYKGIIADDASASIPSACSSS